MGQSDVEFCVSQFCQHWAAGERPRVEDHLKQLNDTDRPSAFAALVRIELEARKQAGENATADEYYRRFPEYAAEMQRLFAEAAEFETGEWQQNSMEPTRLAHSASEDGEATSPQFVEQQEQGLDRDAASQPTRFGDYELIQEIARGGMGVVYRAHQISLDRTVAVKMILAGQLAGTEQVQRFYSEAEAAARLDHPGIVPIYEVGEHDGRHFFSMGYVDGESLANRISRGPIIPRQVAELMLQICEAVQYAHDHGVIHRDLKSANVLLDGSGHPRITDFGLARRLGQDSRLTTDGQIMGTPSYMPPEQASGLTDEIAEQSDIYSLGAILYETLTGRVPFHAASPFETIRQVIENEPPPPRQLNPAIDRDLETICLKCLSKSQTDRYATVRELADELQRFLRREPILASPIGRFQRVWRWCRRKPVQATLCATSTLAVAAILLAWSLRQHAERTAQLAGLTIAFEASLADASITPSFLRQMETTAKAMAVWDVQAATRARQRLYQRFGESIEEAINEPRLTQRRAAEIEAALVLLGEHDKEKMARLREALENKRATWQLQAVVRGPFANIPPVFKPDEVRIEGDVLVPQIPVRVIPRTLSNGKVVTQKDQVIRTMLTCNTSVEVEVEFDERWTAASQIGIVLQRSETEGYAFLVRRKRVPKDPEGIDSATADFAPPEVEIEIRKAGRAMQRISVPVSKVGSGPLTLRAIRERDRLVLQVNTLREMTAFDPFAVARWDDSTVALEWPREVGLVGLRMRRKSEPQEPGLLEQANKLVDQGQWSDALAIYREISAAADDSELCAEAQFKSGVSFTELNRLDEAAEAFAALSEQPGDRWPAMAACRLWLLHLQRKEIDAADRVFDNLASRFSSHQLAGQLPVGDRVAILDTYVRGLQADQYLPARVERVLRIDRFLTPDGRGDVKNQIRMIRLLRYGRHLDTARRMCEDIAKAFPGDVSVTYEYSRLLRQNGQYVQSLDAIASVIEQPFSNAPRPWVLWLERARALAGNEQWERATLTLDELIQGIDQSRLLDTNPSGASHVLAPAYLLKGFMLERLGRRTAALDAWREGYSRTGPVLRDGKASNGIVRLNIMILRALVGENSPDESKRIFSSAVAMVAGETFAQYSKLLVSEETVAAAADAMWKRRRGRKLAEEAYALDVLDLRQRMFAPFSLAISEVFVQEALGGNPAGSQMILASEAGTRLFSLLTSRKLGILQMLKIAAVWKGSGGPAAWDKVAGTLDATSRGLGAYLLAHRYQSLEQAEPAKAFMRAAVSHLAESTEYLQEAQRDLDLLEKQAVLINISNEFVDPVVVNFTQADRLVRSVSVDRSVAIRLPSGAYRVALADSSPELEPTPSQFNIRPGKQVDVRLRWRWAPSESAASWTGLVSKPSSLTRLDRWQCVLIHAGVSVGAVAWSPDGESVAAASKDAAVRIYEVDTGQLRTVLLGPPGEVLALGWSPDGHTLATGGRGGAIRVWEFPSGRLLRILDGHTAQLAALAWNSDGSRLASTGSDRTIRIWTEEGRLERILEGHQSAIGWLSWAPDGNRLASSSYDKTLRIWDLQDEKAPFVISAGNRSFGPIDWSPDGANLAALLGGSVRLWDSKSWRQFHVFPRHNGGVNAIRWRSDAQALAVVAWDAKFTLWDAVHRDPQPLAQTHTDSQSCLAANPVGQEFMSSGYNGQLRIWNDSGELKVEIGEIAHSVRNLSLSPDGSRIAVACHDRSIRILDLYGSVEAALARQDSEISAVQWAGNGKDVFFTTSHQELRRWDIENDATEPISVGPWKSLSALAVHPDGRVAVAVKGAPVRIGLLSESGEATSTCELATNRSVRSLSWQPHGDLLIAANSSAEVFVCDLPSSEVRTLDTQVRMGANAVAWHPSGNLFAAGCQDGTVRIWNSDLSAGPVLQGHTGPVHSVAWNHTGTELVSGSQDHTVRVWSNAGAEKEVWREYPGPVEHVAWHPDGRYVIAAGQISQIHVWDRTRNALEHTLIMLPRGRAAGMGPGGNWITPLAEKKLAFVYVRETPTGKTEVMSPDDFRKLIEDRESSRH